MLADGWLKYGENVRAVYRDTVGGEATVSFFTGADGSDLSNNADGYDTSEEAFRVPKYMRIQRVGDTLTFYVSDDGEDWTNNPRQPQSVTIEGLADTLYVGIAVDSVEGTPTKDYMAEVKYGNITLNGNTEATDELYYTSKPQLTNGSVQARITNLGAESAVFIAAVYDENGNVADAAFKLIPANTEAMDVDLSVNTEGGTVKTFLYPNDMSPCIAMGL